MPDGYRGMGRALQEVLTQEGPGQDLEIEGPSLANARRRQVFQYLCLRPCSRVGDTCRALSLSQATVRWHERNLLENGYLELEANRMFPLGLIDSADAPLFVLLTGPGRASILRESFDVPGVSLQEVGGRVGITRQSASKIASELAQAGLVTVSEDGRFRRIYPTAAIPPTRDSHRRGATRPTGPGRGEGTGARGSIPDVRTPPRRVPGRTSLGRRSEAGGRRSAPRIGACRGRRCDEGCRAVPLPRLRVLCRLLRDRVPRVRSGVCRGRVRAAGPGAPASSARDRSRALLRRMA